MASICRSDITIDASCEGFVWRASAIWSMAHRSAGARLFRGELRVHACNLSPANCASIPGPQQDRERRWRARVNAMRPRGSRAVRHGGCGAQMQPNQQRGSPTSQPMRRALPSRPAPSTPPLRRVHARTRTRPRLQVSLTRPRL